MHVHSETGLSSTPRRNRPSLRPAAWRRRRVSDAPSGAAPGGGVAGCGGGGGDGAETDARRDTCVR